MQGEIEVFETPEVTTPAPGDGAGAATPVSAILSSGKKVKDKGIVTRAMRPEKAFEVFCGKRFVGIDENLSDDISGRNSRRERAANERRVETPHERFHRLRQEVDLLASDLEVAAEETADASRGYGSLVAGVRTLQSDLSRMQRDHLMSETDGSVDTDLSSKVRKRFLNLVDAQVPGAASSSQEAKATYELYYDPAVEQGANGSNAAMLARIAAVESRISRIEGAVGFTDRAIAGHDASLAGLPNRYTGLALGEILGKMETRLSLLNGGEMHTLSRHVKTLRDELKRLNEERRKAKKLANGDKGAYDQHQLEMMHRQLDRWDSVASSVPAIAKRLQTLAALHMQSAHFSSRLQQVESAQGNIAKMISADEQLVNTFMETMKKNAAVMEKNMAHLETKMAALKK